MKKLLFLLLIYVLVEGDNIIGDGLYVYHRGQHAVEELKTKVDTYYPKILEADSIVGQTIDDVMLDTIQPPPVEPSRRRIIRR